MLLELVLCVALSAAGQRGGTAQGRGEAASPGRAAASAPARGSAAPEKTYKSVGPVHYGGHDSQVLYVAYHPDGPARAAMISLTSGGWNSGPMAPGSQASIPPLYDSLGMDYVQVSHRSLHIARHPAQVDDVKAAIRYVKEHAKEWNIDPDRLAVTGRSSGGHLSMLSTYMPDSPKVAAVVERVGPSDFTPEFVATINPKIVNLDYFDELFGPDVKDRSSEAFRRAMRQFSPCTYMDAGDPPTLFMGNREPGPPPPPDKMPANYGVHSDKFVEHGFAQLQAAGGKADIYIGDQAHPSMADSEKAESEFLIKYLKVKRVAAAAPAAGRGGSPAGRESPAAAGRGASNAASPGARAAKNAMSVGPLQYGEDKSQAFYVNYTPDGPARPAMIHINSGGWNSGPLKSKPETPALYDKLGMAYVALCHRSAVDFPHPAQIDDVKAGVAYVKKHAVEWNIDPDRIVLSGTSSGGHLAMMIAYMPDSPKVAAVVETSGPTYMGKEFLKEFSSNWQEIPLFEDLFGRQTPDELDESLKRFSPTGFMSAEDPPTLFMAHRMTEERRGRYAAHHHRFAEYGFERFKMVDGKGELFISEVAENERDPKMDEKEEAFLKKYLLKAGADGARGAAADDKPKPYKQVGPIHYGDHNSQVIYVNYHPEGPARGAMLWINSGGWSSKPMEPGEYPATPAPYEKIGLSLVLICHRAGAIARHPAQIDDVKAAIRYAKDHAKEWNIDPEKLVVSGRSSGGHLAMMSTYMDDSPEVAGVIERVGPTDWSEEFLATVNPKLIDLEYFDQLFGDAVKDRHSPGAKKIFREFSPVTYMSSDDPPTLFEGNREPPPTPKDLEAPNWGGHSHLFVEHGYREFKKKGGVAELYVGELAQARGADAEKAEENFIRKHVLKEPAAKSEGSGRAPPPARGAESKPQAAGDGRGVGGAADGPKPYSSAGPIRYGRHDSQVIYVNYYPEGTARAAMIYINSGGMNSGPLEKRPDPPAPYDSLGLAYVVICHRSLNVAPHPAQVDDVTAGIRYLKSHAKEWNIDPDRLAVTGRSSGGQLAMLATYRPGSPKVAAVVEKSGPTDWRPEFLAKVNGKLVMHPAMGKLFGEKAKDRKSESFRRAMRDFSPVTYMTRDDPPTLFLANKEGPPPAGEIPPNWGVHSHLFAEHGYEAFKEAGGDGELHIYAESRGRGGAADDDTEIAFLKKQLQLPAGSPGRPATERTTRAGRTAAGTRGETSSSADGRTYKSAGPIHYGDHASQVLYVNYYPDGPARPGMAYLNSGGWNSGPLPNQPGMLPLYEKMGLAFVVICHRSIGEFPHPAQVEDAMAGVRYAKKHASEWNIDPDRIAVTGRSSGGHLAMWVGFHPKSPKVAAVVERSGPTDLNPAFVSRVNPLMLQLGLFPQLFGEKARDPWSVEMRKVWREFSPVTYMSEDDPPTLFVGGTDDEPGPRVDQLTPDYNIHSHLFGMRGCERLKEVGGVAEYMEFNARATERLADNDTVERRFLEKYLVGAGKK